MKEPEYVLKNGTRVRTHDVLGSERGMMIDAIHVRARRPAINGTIVGVVSGHGGDVYWVEHVGHAAPAAYWFTEFEVVS